MRADKKTGASDTTISGTDTSGGPVSTLAAPTVDFLLTPGLLETRAWGNKFRGVNDADGKVAAGFTATGDEDMVLRLSGYDIDYADEIEILVNGVSIGFLEAGVNDGYSLHVISIPSELLVAGANAITFAQTGPVSWKWGVTNLAIESAGPAAELTLGDIDTGKYGNNYDGLHDADGTFSMTFAASGAENLRLSFDGYDIDWPDEVEVFLNGVSLGMLAAGLNDATASYEFALAAADLVAGENVLTFRQLTDITWKWGVTNVLVAVDGPDLVAGVTNANAYGNNFNGAADADGAVTLTFAATGGDMRLSLDGYDIDWDDEVEVLLNGTSLGYLSAGVDLGLASYAFDLYAYDLVEGTNTLTFRQATNATWTWGVTNILVEDAGVLPPDPDAHLLTQGATEFGSFGNNFGGTTEPDGSVDFLFAATGGDLWLSFSGYDVDWDDEIEVLLNNVSLGTIAAGADLALAEYTVQLPGGQLLDGTNKLTFRQVGDLNWTWGVTNILVDTAPREGPPPPPANATLAIGVTETGSHGNNFDGSFEPDGVVDFNFENAGTDLALAFDGYDIDYADEVEILLNGVSVGFLAAGVNDGLASYSLLLPAAGLVAETNTISFAQATNLTWKWGVTNLTLSEAVIDPGPVALVIGVTDKGSYGNKFAGVHDSDGIQAATFTSTGEALELRFTAYDVDGPNEIEVVVNGVSLGFLTPGVNDGISTYKFLIPADMQVAGTNNIEFRQAENLTFVWGVTDIRLDIAPETYTPADTGYDEQWHIAALGDIERIWADYTGAGVTVGIYDNGVQYAHHDLDGNYDASLHAYSGGVELDPVAGTAEHGTAVAGIIAAENDGTGTVGIAFGATIAGVDIIGGPASAGSADLTSYVDAMTNLAAFDVVNNSWGSTPGFDQSFETLTLFATTVALFETAAATGRGGLGTVLVKSAGNDAANSAGDMIDSARTTITVAALNDGGNAASYSNHGANVLVSAPSSDGFLSLLGIKTTDLMGADGYAAGNYTGSDAITGFGGTSAAAPMVSGVVALMLDANPDLGWRDVQTILAYSASHTGENVGASAPFFDPFGLLAGYDWQFNGADDWNGGGLHFNENFGYGAVDVFAAVRMAEAWSLFGDAAATSANETSQTIVSTGATTVPSGGTEMVAFAGLAMIVESVEITLTLAESAIDVFLVSAAGTRVQLLDDLDTSGTLFQWTFGAQTFRGEDASGTWHLEFTGAGAGSSVAAWEVTIFGSEVSADDVHHYTDEVFARIIDDGAGTLSSLADDAARMVLADAGGTDWLDLSAMTGNLDVSLAEGVTATSDHQAFLTIGAGTLIENMVAGDGNDTLAGNDADNAIHGMRGADRIAGGGGNDVLSGGAGADAFVFAFGDTLDLVTDFEIGLDIIELWDFGVADFASLAIGADADQNAVVDFGTDVLTLAGVDWLLLGADDFAFNETLLV